MRTLYSPPAPGAAAGAPTPSMRTPYQNMRNLKLDVAQHAPAHGRGTNAEFMAMFSTAAKAN